MATTNLDLTQYLGTDTISFLDDYNSDMSKIDTAIGTNASNIGDPIDLDTTDTSSLVNAINENVAKFNYGGVHEVITGTYSKSIKYNDGTLEIFYSRKYTGMSATTAYGNVYLTSFTETLTTPSITAMKHIYPSVLTDSAISVGWVKEVNNRTNNISVGVVAYVSGSFDATINLHCFGTWK